MATADIFESGDPSAFLSNLLGNIGVDKGPQMTITNLTVKTLSHIVSFIPLRERMGLSLVSHQFDGAVKASITSLNFYRDCLDCLPDDQVKEMLHQYGSQIKSLNFDLFKSTFASETSQWMWRQTVLAFSSLCPNLTELSILICNRHRLRDKDLVTIFEKCPHLTKLCVDAQFLNGHCFKKAPQSLTHVEMEMCYRISDQSLRTIFGRFRKMKTLHVSQLLILSDAHIALMVRSFRNLQELSIVSHVDTKHENLSGSGLAELGKLTKLRVLCLEGLGSVTDRTLTVISDPQVSPTAATITSVSLAFCYNVSQHGLKHLGRMASLVDLNIDGITKRDVSMGVEKIAAEGRLVRLFIAERTNISPEALVAVVQSCPALRLLDISNNEECFNWVTADKIMSFWSPSSSSSSSSRRRPRAHLTILTDEHLAWNIVSVEPRLDRDGRPPVLVVHINRGAVPEHELLPTNALSDVRTSELPHGLLAPHIRRGNRYRLLWAPLGPSKDIKVELYDEQQENGASVAELAMRTAQEMEEGNAFERSSSSIDTCSQSSMEGVECVGVFGSGVGGVSDAAGLPWNAADAAAAAGCDENMPPSDGGRPADFSYTPISADGDPHSKDWSMDVISLLLKTYAYEDGAMVGPMNVKEGIIMRSDGSVEDICSSILQVDASLRARYHMTTTLAGARRFGPHAAAARNAQTDSVAAEIASAIDDFLGNYVPDDSNGGMQPQPLLQHMQHQQQYQQHGHDGMPHPHHPHYHHSQQLQLQPLQPFFSSPYNYENDCQLEESYGGCSENEPPTVAAAAAAAAGYYVPGGHQEGAGPKVAPMRYGVSNNQRPQLQQHYGGRQLQQLQQDQKPRPLQPRSAHEMDNKTGFHLSGGLPTSQPFVPARQRDGLSSAPPLADSSHSPFPPPAHLVARSETAAPARRPFGRLRCGAAAPHANNWTDGASAPGKTSPVSAHHPYHQSGSHHHHNHVPRHRAGARSSILKPRN